MDFDDAFVCGLGGFLVSLILAFFLFIAIQFIAFGRGYSEGERVGRLYKFSLKGAIWKSWEGEIATGTINDKGQANSFDFSIINNSYDPEKIKPFMGKMVKIKYVQWFSSGPKYSSSYEITDMTESN